jgi:predicted RNase H-like HicB family nuclease
VTAQRKGAADGRAVREAPLAATDQSRSLFAHGLGDAFPRACDVLRIEFEKEEDGRWIADIPSLPGVMAYGASRKEARLRVEALALRTLADRLEHGERIPELAELFVPA